MAQPFDAVIFHGDSDKLRTVCEAVAAREGAIVSVQGSPAAKAIYCWNGSILNVR